MFVTNMIQATRNGSLRWRSRRQLYYAEVIVMMMMTVFLLSSHRHGTHAFLLRRVVTTTANYQKTLKDSKLYLFVDGSSLEDYSQHVIESSKTNEWGIPHSETLDPLWDPSLSSLDGNQHHHHRAIIPHQLPNGGRVTLMGSGPGDPDLLTVKAHRLLQDPNTLVICDRLVSSEILQLIQGEVKVARKLPGCAELAQEEIYWWSYQGLKAGRHIIRLKIGDPFVFGRGGEEVLTFRRFGVEPIVIPVRSLVSKKKHGGMRTVYKPIDPFIVFDSNPLLFPLVC